MARSDNKKNETVYAERDTRPSSRSRTIPETTMVNDLQLQFIFKMSF